MLGSPNGRGVAWFLIQHKQAFGLKIVGRVALFKEGRRVYCGFWVGDVKEEEGGEGEERRKNWLRRGWGVRMGGRGCCVVAHTGREGF